MLDQGLLEPEQEELLVTLVEAARSVPRTEREPFLVIHPLGASYYLVSHAALPRDLDPYPGDWNALIREGLLAQSQPDDADLFDITTRGFAYYQELKKRSASPMVQVETEIRQYLDADRFRQRYPEAYRKWAEAAERLWVSDSEREFTRIGHDCREALQIFVTTLVDRFRPTDVDPNKQHDRARLKAVLEQQKQHLSETEHEFLDALYNYWGALSGGLVQRQEHGGQREKEPLTWEDGRRVVFQAAVVMNELDRSLMRNR